MEMKLVILFILGVVVQTHALTTQAPQNCDVEDGPLFLSPYIASSNIEEARRKSRVSCLPGGDNVESYSGYLTVDAPSCGSNLFFWFFPAAENPQTAPVLMWLNGGPGRSSMYGAIFENGPLQLKDRTKLGTTILTERPTNWARVFSMLYVDNPVGTGFSVTTGNCYAQNTEDVSRNLYSFMVQFYQIFPEYASLEFYVGGQSYAGKYVPAFAHFIHHQNVNEQQTVHIPLAGVYLGGGFCDPPSMLSALPDYLYSVGMYSKHSRDAHRQKIEEGLAKPNHNPFYPEDKDGYEYISYYFGYMYSKTGYASFDNILHEKVQLDEFSLPEFFNRTDVVRALHAQHNFSQNFLTVVLRFGNDFMKSTKLEMGFLMDHYKVLYYTGSLDVVANINMAEAFLLSTPWSGREAYGTMDRILWKYQKYLAGYVTKVNNFTRVIVRNAGHDVPHDQPEWTLAMMKNFISDISWSR